MGDFFYRARRWLRTKGESETRESIGKAVRAAEIIGLDLHQAEYDSREATAARDVLSSLEDVGKACVRIGSLLIVKYPVQGEPVVLVRTLSHAEIQVIERFPEIQTQPDKVFEELSMAIGALQALSVDSSKRE